MDIAHKETDDMIEAMEKRIASEYKKAGREVSRKMDAYLQTVADGERVQRAKMEAGEISPSEFQHWLHRHIMIGKRWKDTRDVLAEDMHNANQIARRIIKGGLPDVYAVNRNYAAYTIEHGLKINASFSLYDRHTVERLMRDNPKLLPDPVPGSRTAQAILRNKDLRWNRQLISSSITQSILQGETIGDMARRLETVTEANFKNAVRNARTACTAAENSGRLDCFKEAEELGIEQEKTWESTLDSRTRHEHRMLHGQTVPIDEPFEVDGYQIMYPGDPDAEPEMVYNCRCTMTTQIVGYERDRVEYSPGMGDMSFDEWQHAKRRGD